MILNDDVKADNNFARAYNALSKDDKARVRESVMVACEITEGTFYNWVHRPELVTSKLNQRYIAYLIFNKPIKEFFR